MGAGQSGGRYPCSGLQCRKDRAESLQQFAAFYSDKTYIHNFLINHIQHHDNESYQPDESYIQKKFAEDLFVIFDLLPCIEAGYVTPITPPNYCPTCLSIEPTLGPKEDRILEQAANRLTREFNANVDVIIQRVEDEYKVVCRGPESLLEDGFLAHTNSMLPPELVAMPKILSLIESGREVTLSKTAVKKAGFDKHLSLRVSQSVFFEIASAQCLDTSLLTDTQVEIDFIRGIKTQASQHQLGAAVGQQLNTMVPFLGNLSASDIIKLREGEREHFILFRQALNKAVSEYANSHGVFSTQDAKHLHYDVIEPALAKLDLQIKNAQRSILKGTGRKVLALTGVISAGMYAGFLPSSLAAIASTLGLTRILADLSEDLLAHGDAKETIRNDEMYFLWQVQRAAKRKKGIN